MGELNNLKITERRLDLENDVLVVAFDNGKALQCCLKELPQNELKQHAGGLVAAYAGRIAQGCAEANAWLDLCFEDDAALKVFFIEQGQLAGIQIIA